MSSCTFGCDLPAGLYLALWGFPGPASVGTPGSQGATSSAQAPSHPAARRGSGKGGGRRPSGKGVWERGAPLPGILTKVSWHLCLSPAARSDWPGPAPALRAAPDTLSQLSPVSEHMCREIPGDPPGERCAMGWVVSLRKGVLKSPGSLEWDLT